MVPFPIEAIARLAYEVNRAYCVSLGDSFQPSWEQAPEQLRQNVRDDVARYLNGDHGPEAAHEAWRAKKLADGWRHGHEQNDVHKTDPHLLPFSQLGQEQQAKEYIFHAVVMGVARLLLDVEV